MVEAVDQLGSMSPGCATGLRCADGTRAFVKAVGTDLNRDTPTLFRREITALTLWLAAFDDLAGLPDAPVPAWVRAEAAEWRERMAVLADCRTDTLVHWDVRVDNLLQRRTGEIVFLDWGAAGVGESWLDPLLARLERVDRAWFDRSVATSPALTALGDDAITTWLVGIGTNLAVRAVTAVDVNLPTLADFRRVESARFLGAAARRLGL